MREAVTILGAAHVDASIVWEVVSAWYPRKLVRRLKREDEEAAIAFITASVILDTPDVAKRDDDDASDATPVYESVTTFEDHLAEYRATYNCDPLDEPYPYFVLMSARIGFVQAREQYRYIEAKSLPHIRDDRERREQFDRLYKNAKLPKLNKEAERERKRRLQREQLAALDPFFDALRNNPNA